MSETVKHSTMSGVNAHAITRWDVASAQELPTELATADKGKVAFLQDTGQFMILQSADPVEWASLSYTGDNPITGASLEEHTLTLTFEDETTQNLTLPEAPNAVTDVSLNADDDLLFTFADGTSVIVELPEVYSGNAVEFVSYDSETEELTFMHREGTTTVISLGTGDDGGGGGLETGAVFTHFGPTPEGAVPLRGQTNIDPDANPELAAIFNTFYFIDDSAVVRESNEELEYGVREQRIAVSPDQPSSGSVFFYAPHWEAEAGAGVRRVRSSGLSRMENDDLGDPTQASCNNDHAFWVYDSKDTVYWIQATSFDNGSFTLPFPGTVYSYGKICANGNRMMLEAWGDDDGWVLVDTTQGSEAIIHEELTGDRWYVPAVFDAQGEDFIIIRDNFGEEIPFRVDRDTGAMTELTALTQPEDDVSLWACRRIDGVFYYAVVVELGGTGTPAIIEVWDLENETLIWTTGDTGMTVNVANTLRIFSDGRLVLAGGNAGGSVAFCATIDDPDAPQTITEFKPIDSDHDNFVEVMQVQLDSNYAHLLGFGQHSNNLWGMVQVDMNRPFATFSLPDAKSSIEGMNRQPQYYIVAPPLV